MAIGVLFFGAGLWVSSQRITPVSLAFTLVGAAMLGFAVSAGKAEVVVTVHGIALGSRWARSIQSWNEVTGVECWPGDNGWDRLVLEGARRTDLLIPVSQRGELLERVRLRWLGARLPFPDAAQMLESYFDPAVEPLGVVRRHGRWQPFHRLEELESVRDVHRDVFIRPRDFEALLASSTHDDPTLIEFDLSETGRA